MLMTSQYNKLRNYRNEVTNLDRQLREHRQQASSAKNKYADWNVELQQKLKEFREEKKTWITEAAELRTKEKETQALFAAQGKLLAEAQAEVFLLQTQRKEVQHKIDRLKDYEVQIAEHIKMQSLWYEHIVTNAILTLMISVGTAISRSSMNEQI
jgi:chromosome segregation ATPase